MRSDGLCEQFCEIETKPKCVGGQGYLPLRPKRPLHRKWHLELPSNFPLGYFHVP